MQFGRTVASILALVRWENALLSVAGVVLGAWWATGRPNEPETIVMAGVAILADGVRERRQRRARLTRSIASPIPSVRCRLDAVHRDGADRGGHQRGGRAGSRVPARWRSNARCRWRHRGDDALQPWRESARRSRATSSSPSSRRCRSCSARGVPDRPSAGIPLFLVGVPLHFAREIAKDIDDVDGDAAHRRTLPASRRARHGEACRGKFRRAVRGGPRTVRGAASGVRDRRAPRCCALSRRRSTGIERAAWYAAIAEVGDGGRHGRIRPQRSLVTTRALRPSLV